MRTIKFRVWSDKEKKLFYPEFYSFESGVMLWNWREGDFNSSSKIFQQFTGLYDKNKKEIYEGDIVKTGDGQVGRIRYDDSIAAYKVSFNKIGNESKDCDNALVFDELSRNANPKNVEIIGNIFEK